MARFKFAIIATLSLLLIVTAVQNAEVVELRLLIWKFPISRVLLVFLCTLSGLVVGYLIGTLGRLKRSGGSSGSADT